MQCRVTGITTDVLSSLSLGLDSFSPVPDPPDSHMTSLAPRLHVRPDLCTSQVQLMTIKKNGETFLGQSDRAHRFISCFRSRFGAGAYRSKPATKSSLTNEKKIALAQTCTSFRPDGGIQSDTSRVFTVTRHVKTTSTRFGDDDEFFK